jgi:hypothetical protein
MPPPPCGGFGWLSCGCAVLRGCSRVDPGRVCGSRPACSAFIALQALDRRAVLRLAPEATLHGLPLRFKARSPGPRAVPTGCPAYGTTLPLLDSFCPTTHASQVDPFADSGSLRCRVPRAGFGYPLRDVHHLACRRVEHAGAPMGLSLQGLPLVAIGAPLGAHALMPLPAAPHPPGGGCGRPGRLQGFVPATSPCCHRNLEWFRPSIPSWGSALQSLLPFVLARALIAAPPLSPLGRLDVQARLGLRVLRCERGG